MPNPCPTIATEPSAAALRSAAFIVASVPTKSSTASAPSGADRLAQPPRQPFAGRDHLVGAESRAACIRSSRASTATMRAAVCSRSHCTRVCAETADADDDRGRVLSGSLGRTRCTAWYDVAPASVSGATTRGSRSPSGTSSLRRTTMCDASPPSRPEPAAAPVVDAVVVGAAQAPAARPARRHARDRDGVALGEVGRRSSPTGLDPAGDLVAEGERDVVRQDAGGGVEEQHVGVAEADAADAHEHLVRSRLQRRHVVEPGRSASRAAGRPARVLLSRVSDTLSDIVTGCRQ